MALVPKAGDQNKKEPYQKLIEMKKVIMLVMVAIMTLAVSQKAQAIEDPNRKGTTVIGLRAGFLPGVGSSATVDITAVNNWWKGHFAIGAYAGFNFPFTRHIVDGTNYDVIERTVNIGIMPRASYGLNITKDFEVHAGVMMGAALHRHYYTYNYHNGEVNHDSENDWFFCHGEFIGVRYYFTPNFGVEAEANYSNYMSYLNVGFTFRF